MNNQKIAFITCVNDEAEYTECRYYIEKLHIPEGYCTDIIGIREAISMAQGYNVGMGSTDARYKVYLHQDTFIKNVDFIKELLRIFTYDVKIGLLGVIGNTNIKKGGGKLKYDHGMGYRENRRKLSEMELWNTFATGYF